MNQYGDGIEEPYAHGGAVHFGLKAGHTASTSVRISPDEARLLGLRLIKVADEAEGQEW
ncbi:MULTISPECIES: hypothetical protein [unclassified Streptomyces]|uniref:hypothetical protein n=1 Tax=unclassified Streptomyces TaxID=2593676 RepID=UPI00340FE9EF